MNPEENLVDLDALDLRRFRRLYGFVEPLGLTATFDFSAEDFRRVSMTDDQRPESLRTAFHEINHVYQLLATSYGFYVQLLWDYQCYLVVAMLGALRERCKLKPQLPLFRQIRSLEPDSTTRDLQIGLSRWYQAELLRALLEDDTDIFIRQVDNATLLGPLVRNFTMVGNFAILESHLINYINTTGQAKLPDPDVLRLDRTKDDLEQEEELITSLKLGAGLDAGAVIESASKAAEYWGQSGPMPSELKRSDIENGMIKYLALIHRALDILDIDDVGVFALTYGVIADVALNPAILPHHRTARTGNFDLGDLHPLARTLKGLAAAQQLRPVSDLESDYDRFAFELCDSCGWRTPVELGRMVLGTAAEHEKDYTTSLYFRSLSLRARAPWIFNDFGVWSLDQDEMAAELTYLFVPPVMQFTDKTLFHSNKLLARRFIEGYLIRRYLRSVLVSRDLTIHLPYQADPDEVEYWESWTRGELESLGFRRPRVLIRSASRHRR